MQRLRGNLRRQGIRQDLVQIDHHGNVEIVQYTDDRISLDTGDST